MAEWANGFWWSRDGLRLHYREYGRDAGGIPIICMPDLTRNARDYAPFADALASDRRLLCVDFRGRGESAYAPDSLSYMPVTYVQDMESLIAELKLDRFILLGTGAGAVVAMLLAAAGVSRVAGIVLNDRGPHAEPEALSRAREQAGRSGAWPTWLHAARAIAETNGEDHPGWSLDDWLAMAKRVCRLTPQGRIVLDYDLRLADTLRLPAVEPGVDLWDVFDAIASVPMLLVKGERSQFLSEATLEMMAARHPGLSTVVVPRVGHSPMLTEPNALGALEAFFDRTAGPVADGDRPTGLSRSDGMH